MGGASSSSVAEAPWLRARLRPEEYRLLSAYVEQTTGIRMPPSRRTMLEGRLRTRLRELELDDFGAYVEYALGSGGNAVELQHLVDRATTNTTEFFREKAHFDYLLRHALPDLATREDASQGLFVWSAACSTGEEVYTLGMVLAEAEGGPGKGRHRIYGTDISQFVLRFARNAVYPVDRVQGIPKELRGRYLLSSKDRERPMVRIIPALRNIASFGVQNLMDEEYRLPRPVDVLFCRNVLIYFERHDHERILRRFARVLSPSGYLFLGHTDSTHGLDVPFVQVAPSVYRLVGRRPLAGAPGHGRRA